MNVCHLRLLVLLLVSSVGAASQSIQPIDTAKFDDLCTTMQKKVQRSLDGKKIPGVTAAVVLADGHTCQAATGSTGRPDGRKLTPDDPILAASIGKTFVSALALQLVEEGKLALDDHISKYLSDRPWFAKLPNAQDITLRMLMNHSSGIPNHVDEKGFLSTAMKTPDRVISFDYLLTFVLGKKPLFAAGKGFNYADTNYILLAMIEEQVAGTKMYDEVTRRFLKPLRLDHTTPSDKNLDPAVYGIYEKDPVVRNGRLIMNPQWEWAGGGFYSTPIDLARWAVALYGGTVLQKASFDQLIGGTTTGEGKEYGLGVEVFQRKWGVIYGHGGEWPGYLSVMRYYPRFGIAVADQINAGGTPEADTFPDALAEDLADLFIDEMVTDKLTSQERSGFEKQTLDWLHLVDAGKLAESWDGMVSAIKAKYTRATWPDALKPVRIKAGALKSRSVHSIVETEKGKVTVDFSSSFTKLPTVRETVTLTLESDGKWRISGYGLHG